VNAEEITSPGPGSPELRAALGRRDLTARGDGRCRKETEETLEALGCERRPRRETAEK